MNSDEKNQYKKLLEETLKLENQKQAYQQKLIRSGEGDRVSYQKRIKELEGIIFVNMEKIKSLKAKK